MTERTTPHQSRRDLLIGLATAGIGLAARPAVGLDRPMISTGRITMCNNAGVKISGLAGRLSTTADFSQAHNCTLSGSTVEGPYFICTDTMNTRNIAEGLEGTPMTLAIRVTDQMCSPVPGAIVDVWHCDARGRYSGHAVDPDNPARVGRGIPRTPDSTSRFLRGVLATDADGIVEFDAIYPGYYNRRAVHTHFKVHIGNRAYLTSQALYPEEWNEKIAANPLYTEGRRNKRTLNSQDFFGRAGKLFTVTERAGHLLAAINVSIQ